MLEAALGISTYLLREAYVLCITGNSSRSQAENMKTSATCDGSDIVHDARSIAPLNLSLSAFSFLLLYISIYEYPRLRFRWIDSSACLGLYGEEKRRNVCTSQQNEQDNPVSRACVRAA